MRDSDRLARAARPEGSLRQTFGELVIHTPYTTVRYRLPWTFSTFDYRELCELLADQAGVHVRDREGRRPARRVRPHRPRRHPRDPRRRCPRVAAGARRRRATSSRPTRCFHAGSRSIRGVRRRHRDLDRPRTSPPATAGAFRPATSCESASARSIPASTCAADRPARHRSRRRPGPLPGQLDPARLRNGDRGRSVLRRRLGRPLPAADRRGNPYCSLFWACSRSRPSGSPGCRGNRLGGAVELLPLQRLARAPVRMDAALPAPDPARRAGPARRRLRAMERRRFLDWAFGHYLEIAHPRFVAVGPRRTPLQVRVPA